MKDFIHDNLDKLIVLLVIVVLAALAFVKDTQFWQGALTGSLSALYLLIRPNKTTPSA